MDGKKVEMTDEKIIKALECCSGEKGVVCSIDCPAYYLGVGTICQDKLIPYALDLIHRLQAEIEHKKKCYDELCNMNNDMACEIAEQKAEIERLTEENEYLDMCGKQFLADYQKCEIENAELQKQVDELTEECSNKQYEIERLEAEKKFLQEQANILAGVAKRYSEDKEQDVKDTVAKIIVELNRTKNIFRENYGISEQVGVDMAINRVEEFYKELTEGKA